MKKPLILLGMVALTSSCFFSTSQEFELSYENPESYTTYTESTPVDLNPTEGKLTKLDITWISGEVELALGDKIHIVEKNISGTYLPLCYWLNGSELHVQYCSAGKHDVGPGGSQKKLMITVPEVTESVELYSISANIKGTIGSTESVETVSTSGSVSLKATSILTMESNSVSGSLELETGKLGSLKNDTTSGSLTLAAQTVENVEFNSVSGSLSSVIKDSADLKGIKAVTTSGSADITLDGKKGYDLRFASSSGVKDLAFTAGTDASLSKFSLYFSSISGSLTVKKAD